MKGLPPYLRRKIINSLKSVEHDSIAGFACRKFAAESEQKTDAEVIQCISDIKSQIVDNGPMLKRILGSEFNFINNLHIPAKYSREAAMA